VKAEYLLDLYDRALRQNNSIGVEGALTRILRLSRSVENFSVNTDEIREIISNLIISLRHLRYHNHPLYLSADISRDSIFRFLGKNLADRLESLYYDHINDRLAFNSSIHNMQSHYVSSIASAESVINGMVSVGIELMPSPSESIQLVILFPKNVNRPDVDTFRRKLSDVSAAIENFYELLDGERPSVFIDGISASRITIFIESSLKVATMLSVTIAFSLDSIIKIQEISKNHLELSEIVSDDIPVQDRFLEDTLRKLAEKCAAEIAAQFEIDGDDSADAAIRRINACHQTIRLLAEGYSFQFRSQLLDQDFSEKADSDSPGAEKGDRLYVSEIKRNAEAIAQLELLRRHPGQALLEAQSE
jgi:hypothetical protein